ncbi:lytic transglycosylase domain-containing protein [Kiloniella sp. b19]|uniref:lytic transglycosylase domain-containing protein n=1 Tax=Kiloniella sp. GXU_MW_B19 TaxID=3141326 RepID=UPI0031D81E58
MPPFFFLCRLALPLLAKLLLLASLSAVQASETEKKQADAQSSSSLFPDSSLKTLSYSGREQVELPSPLGEADVKLYKRLFALGEQGRWPEIDSKLDRLENPVLLGHLMAQRYLHPFAYRSGYKELKSWMEQHADHPQAATIYKLALQRRPKNHTYPRKPEKLKAQASNAYGKTYRYRPNRKLSKADSKKAQRLSRQLRWNIYNQRLSITEDVLKKAETRRLLDPVELNQHKMALAAAWYHLGRDEKAYRFAKAATVSEKYLPMSHWTAGLAAWRMEEFEQAAQHFEAMARAERLGSWNKAAGAYWAARSALKLKQPEKISSWLHRAAGYPRTFYGLLARKTLGLDIDFHHSASQLETAGALASHDAFLRVAALLQLDMEKSAREELSLLSRRVEQENIPTLIAVAEQSGFPKIAFRLGAQLAASEGDERDPANNYGLVEKALFPVPVWEPRNGYNLDRALIYAFMRQESGFNPDAKSPAGARGLLQLMPGTARYISEGTPYNGKDRSELFKPDINLLLGQKYIAYLLEHKSVEGNLVKLMAAYNGGPGNLLKWVRETEFNDDPLLFIESIPSRETRIFIERVLTNLWIYRARLRQQNPSLEAIASGEWPLYRSVDLAINRTGSTSEEKEVASHVKN